MVGADWVRTYDGALTPEVLLEALAWAERRTGRPNAGSVDDEDRVGPHGLAGLQVLKAEGFIEHGQPVPVNRHVDAGGFLALHAGRDFS